VERANAEILKSLKTRTYDGLKSMVRSGSMSFRVHYEATGHHTVEPRREAPFFMVYGAKAVLPQRSPWALYVSKHTMKPRRTSFGVMILTCSTSEDGNLLFKMHCLEDYDQYQNMLIANMDADIFHWCKFSFVEVAILLLFQAWDDMYQ
jgi:hypothetical protein